MIINTLKYLKQSISMLEYKQYVPKNYTMDDIFLVSYPKSGNTWLRFLIANAIKVHYGIDREVNFFSIQDIIPGIRNSGRAITPRGPFGKLDLPRIIKSHASYNPYYCRVILLVRDPRDVMVSYYHYLKGYGSLPEISLKEFIRHKDYGIEAWLEHTESWYSNIKPGQMVQLFLYEDFVNNPQEQLKRLMNLLGIKLEDANLNTAVSLSSKENMRKSATESESTFKIKILENNFIRNAQVNKENNMDNVDRQYIKNKTENIAQLLGYNYN